MSAKGLRNLINNQKAYGQNINIKDIKSDVDANSGTENSDFNTSMSSFESGNKSIKNIFKENSNECSPIIFKNQKELIREFTKLFLKIKFEMISSVHSGQSIDSKLLWKQVLKKGIPKEKWDTFIYSELQNPQNYPKKSSVKSINQW